MPRVICPRCRTGFEAKLSRKDYAVNCVSCGIAFNAAAYLPKEDFAAVAEARSEPGSAVRPEARVISAASPRPRPAATPPPATPASGLFPSPRGDEPETATTAPLPMDPPKAPTTDCFVVPASLVPPSERVETPAPPVLAPAAPAPAAEAAAPPASRHLGRRPAFEGPFGPYEIESEIARGGVGAVFRARERDGGRLVALKVLLDGNESDAVERERFKRECETAKALSLPGMVQVYGVGEVDAKPYMAMELIEGCSLDRLICEKALSVQESLVIMQGVAETVGALHKAGYVHRDLKPANILLDPYHVPKVTDFGLVKSLDEVTRLTASGLVCGTPAYMAPEQARGDGKAIDPRTDVWALGAVLYEMLVAHPPFQADNALRLMLKITKENPRPPREVNPKVPRDVERIVLKCLDKNPDRRYPDATALARDVQRFLDGQPVEANATTGMQGLLRGAHEKRRLLIGAGIAAAGVLIAALLARFALAPHEAGPHAEHGWTQLQAGRLADAEDAFRMALKLDPQHSRAKLGLGVILGLRSVDLEKKRVKDAALFGEALKLLDEAGRGDEALKPEAAAQAGLLFARASLPEQEVGAYARAVRLKNDNPEYYQGLALAYWRLGSKTQKREYLESAVRAFQMVLTLNPQNPNARRYIQELQERWLPRTAAGPTPPAGLAPASAVAAP